MVRLSVFESTIAMKTMNCIVAVAMFVAASMQPLLAADYPEKTIRIIVPYTPGGTADMLARSIGQKLAASLKQQVIVDNRPGAGGNIGADLPAKSAPDGYTILMGPGATPATNPNLYRSEERRVGKECRSRWSPYH